MDRRRFLKKAAKYALLIPPLTAVAVTAASMTTIVANELNPGLLDSLTSAPDAVRYEEFLIGSTRIKFLGVMHLNDVEKFHHDQILEVVRSSEVLVSEANPGTRNMSNDRFYAGIEEMCLRHNRAIINADPRNATPRASSVAIAWDAVMPYAYVPATKNLENKQWTPAVLAPRIAAHYLAASTLLGGAFFDLTIGMNRKISYGTTDFSNIIVTDRLAKIANNYSTIGIIYGMAHMDDMKYYLEHPRIREAKRLAYLPLRLATGTPAKLFTVNNGVYVGQDLKL